jgi:PAS domain S-box-containing protein
MRNRVQILKPQPEATIIQPRGSFFVFAGWKAWLCETVAPALRPQERSPQATLRLIGFLIIYTGSLGVLGTITPKLTNLDFFYLAGCALAGWAAGVPTTVAVVVASVLLLHFQELHVDGSATNPWIIFCNSSIRLLAFVATAWVARVAARRTRNLELNVQERTARLQKEVARHKETSDFLSEAIQLFRQVTENIADVFWVTNPTKTEVEYISPGFERVWGHSCAELYASPALWLEGIHPDDRQRVALATSSLQIRGQYDEQYRVLRPDGALRWVHDRAFPVKNEEGAVFRIVGIAEDITERKAAEQLLRAERDLGAALSCTSELQYAVKRLLDIAVQLEGIDCGGVYLMNETGDELRLVAHRGMSSAFVESVGIFKADAAEVRMANAGRVTYVRHEQVPRNLRALWGGQGIRSLAVVPLRHNGAVLGMLNLASFREDDISPRLRLGIELIASQVAAALARIGAEESLRCNEARLRAIIRNAPVALLVIDDNGLLVFTDGQALSRMGIQTPEQSGRIATEVFNDSPLMQANIRRALKGESFSSVVTFGESIFDFHYTPGGYGGAGTGGVVAVAVDITEQFRLERQILEISDREQARIGQDVHDGLCQQLVGAAFIANSLQQTLGSQQSPEHGRSQRICALLDDAMTESRRVARGLYPVRLASEGIGPALQELARVTSERFQVACVCEAVAIPSCEPTAAIHLYRITQEAVNNAVKHSGARRIVLSLKTSDQQICLEVKDNGKGFTPNSNHRTGMGLCSMEYRSRSLGANLQIDSGKGGTTIRCEIPRNICQKDATALELA